MSRICRKGPFYAILASENRIFLHVIYKTILTCITDNCDILEEIDSSQINNVIFNSQNYF
jgi:hypothetical protein